MQIITNQEQIAAIVKGKAINELQMAQALCAEFDKTTFPLRDTLHTIVRSALKTLIQFNTYLKDLKKYPETAKAVVDVYVKESKLKILTGTVKKDAAADLILQAVSDKLTKLFETPPDTQGIGEVVRLFAGVCEDVKKRLDVLRKDNNNNPEIAAVEKLAFVLKPEGTVLSSFHDFCALLGAYRTTDYGIMAFNAASRSRSQADFNGHVIDRDIAVLLNPSNPAAPVAAGNTFFAPLLPGDVVRCIDEILGLPQGASISGTTSDTIWTLETLANMLYGNRSADRNLLLLAVAAIVSGYHHTAIEIGLALSINYAPGLAYQPGVYTSFQDSAMVGTQAGKSIQAILAQYENAEHNAYVYIVSDNSGKKTLYLVDKNNKAEVEEYKAAVTMSFATYKKWKAISNAKYFSKEAVQSVVIAKLG